MKNLLLPLLLAVICMASSGRGHAQQLSEADPQKPKGAIIGIFGGMRIDEVGVNLGVNNDRYQSMDTEFFRNYTNRTSLTDIDLSGFTSDEEFALNVGGSMVGVELTLTPARLAKNARHTQQLRVALDFVVDREAMVVYTENGTYNDIVYCIIQNEAMLNVSYIFRANMPSGFSFFGGAGATAGKTFGNRFIFINDTDETFPGEGFSGYNTTDIRARSSQFARLYVPFGLDYTFGGGFRFGLEGRYGLGVENVAGHATHFIKNNIGVQMNFNYILPAGR